jgi:membrane-associated protease RseP (regulator of RpoE activity)
MDMGALPSAEGVVEDGLVGFEMFRRFGVTIDYEQRVLTLADKAHFTPPAGAHVVPFELDAQIPIVHGTLDGLAARISVDTGSRASLTLHSPFVNEHGLVAKYGAAPEMVVGWGVGGKAMGRPARFGALTLGDVTIPDIAGDLYGGTKGAFANPDLSGNLGGGVLRRFTVAFDYDAHKMYLAPNKSFDDADPFDRSGLWLMKDGDALEVVSVAPGSAAATAGIAADDRIAKIDGAPVASQPLAEWRRRLRKTPAGAHVGLTLANGKKVDLALADIIPPHATIH